MPPPRPRTRAAFAPRAGPGTQPAGGIAAPPGGSGRNRSDDRPNTIRCRTARSAYSFPSSAACSAFSVRSRPFSSRSSAVSRASSRFASSAAASTSRSDAQQPPIRDNASRNRHPAQQTPSPAATHAPRAAFAAHGPRGRQHPITRIPNTYAVRGPSVRASVSWLRYACLRLRLQIRHRALENLRGLLRRRELLKFREYLQVSGRGWFGSSFVVDCWDVFPDYLFPLRILKVEDCFIFWRAKLRAIRRERGYFYKNLP